MFRFPKQMLTAVSNVNKMSVKTMTAAGGHKVNVEGVDIFYEKVGHGQKTLILLPGSLGTSRPDYTPQLDDLDHSKFTMIAWHPPGYGLSRPFERYWQDDYLRKDAHFAAKLMKHLGFNRYSILGWSGGGTTGLILAAAQPNNVEKLVAWSANSFLSPREKMISEVGRDPSLLPEGMRKSFEQIYGKEEFERLWPQLCDAYGRYDDICKGDLPKIMCPVLVLHGKKDLMVHYSHAEYLVQNIPDVRVHWFPDGGHNIHQKYAEEFNQLIQSFLLEEDKSKL